MSTHGFLVVEQVPREAQLSPNVEYRGIDRTPPWSQTAYEGGFNDPYVFDGVTDTRGLLPTREVAALVKSRFKPVYQPNELEVIWVTDALSAVGPDLQLLGYDVAASRSPFSSALVDPPVDARARQMLRFVGQYGLFESALHAQNYLDIVNSVKMPAEGTFTVWKVFRSKEE